MTNAVCLSSSGTHHDRGDALWREGSRASSVAVSSATKLCVRIDDALLDDAAAATPPFQQPPPGDMGRARK